MDPPIAWLSATIYPRRICRNILHNWPWYHQLWLKHLGFIFSLEFHDNLTPLIYELVQNQELSLLKSRLKNASLSQILKFILFYPTSPSRKNFQIYYTVGCLLYFFGFFNYFQGQIPISRLHLPFLLLVVFTCPLKICFKTVWFWLPRSWCWITCCRFLS